MKKEYVSFAEIDYQLKLLSLKRDIARERLLLKRNKIQAGVHPSHILGFIKKKVQTSLFYVVPSVLFRKLRPAKKK